MLMLPVIFGNAGAAFAQTAPLSPDRPWHDKQEQQIESDVSHFRESRFSIDSDRTYALAELIDLAEAHNPETRVAWEGARSTRRAWCCAKRVVSDHCRDCVVAD
jgi:outer membrane protein